MKEFKHSARVNMVLPPGVKREMQEAAAARRKSLSDYLSDLHQLAELARKSGDELVIMEKGTNEKLNAAFRSMIDFGDKFYERWKEAMNEIMPLREEVAKLREGIVWRDQLIHRLDRTTYQDR